MIEVFTSPTCFFCKILKKDLEKENISFIEKDVSIEKNKNEFDKLGINSFPVTRIREVNIACLVIGAQTKNIINIFRIMKTNSI